MPAGGMRDLLDVVHGLNGRFGIGLLGEANEAEAAAATSVAVLDDNLENVRMRIGARACATGATYGFFDLAKLFELLAKSGIVSVPGEATEALSALELRQRRESRFYPMKSLDIARLVRSEAGRDDDVSMATCGSASTRHATVRFCDSDGAKKGFEWTGAGRTAGSRGPGTWC